MLWLNLINDNDVRKAYITTIYEKHGKQIWYYLKSVMISRDEDDIYSCCNDVFMVAYQKYNIIKDYETIIAWLMRVAKGVAQNHNRTYGARKKHFVNFADLVADDDDTFDPVDQSVDISQRVVDDMMSKALINDKSMQIILNTLSASERELYKLRYVDRLSNEAIAQLLVITDGAVRTRISRLHQKITKIVYEMSYTVN